MKNLKFLKSNCAKIIVIIFISTIISISVFSQQGPPTTKFPDVNGQNQLQPNDILRVGSHLQIDHVNSGRDPGDMMMIISTGGEVKKAPIPEPIIKPPGLNGPPSGNPNAIYWRTTGNNIVPGDFIGTLSGNTEPLVIKTNGVERMRVSTAGRVGIGTTTPSQKLEVQGSGGTGGTNIYVNETGNAAAGVILDPGSGGTRVGMFSTANGNPLQGPGKLTFKNMADSTTIFEIDINSGIASLRKVRIGSQSISGTHSNAQLMVAGKIVSRSSFVTIQNWGDYVLHKDYKLPSLLNEVEPYIKENKHLIGVPSEKEILENGVNLGEMDAIQMVKIEELMLYTIEQQKQIDELKKEVAALKGNNIFNSLFGYIFFGFLMAAILVLKKDSLFK